MKKLFLFLFILNFMGINPVFANETPKLPQFLGIADIHFDPFTDCEKRISPCLILKKLETQPYQAWEGIFEKYGKQHLSHYGQDTNYFLLKSMLAELQKLNENEQPQFVFILGDFLVHEFKQKYVQYSAYKTKASYQRFVKKVLQFLTMEINKTFPKTDIYPAIGNNDTYTSDYSIVPNGAFLADTNTIWSQLIKNKTNLASFQKSFPYSGYYAVTNPYNAKQKILVLNTVVFSTKNNQDRLIQPAIQAQLTWLVKQLNEARKQQQKVILAFHIPLGLNVSNYLKDTLGSLWKFWDSNYQKDFKRIVKDFPDTITAILVAHIHRDTFQFLILNEIGKVPVTVASAISPIFGNNPSVKMFSFDPVTFQIKSVKIYSKNLENSQNEWESTEYEQSS